MDAFTRGFIKRAGQYSQRDPIVRSVLESIHQYGVDPKKLNVNQQYIKHLGFDELDAVEHVMDMEEAHKIMISDRDAERIRTPQQMIDHIRKHAK